MADEKRFCKQGLDPRQGSNERGTPTMKLSWLDPKIEKGPVCVCVCQHLSLRNFTCVQSRGPGRIHRRLVNEAGDVSEDMEMGCHFHAPANF